MNPPFSAAAHVDGKVADAALRHVASALARLAEGGRMVAITGANLSPDNPAWRDGFVRLQERGRVVFSAAIDGRVYARHGTSVETCLTVIDRAPADDPTAFPPSPGAAPDAATLLDWVIRHLQPRAAMADSPAIPAATSAGRPALARSVPRVTPSQPIGPAPEDAVEVAYEPCDWAPAGDGRISEALYECYGLQSIRIADAKPHPTRLVQSAAMASDRKSTRLNS